MQLIHQAAYQSRHPNAVLVTPEFPHCAAALNALFANDAWERDEDINDTIGEEVDLSTDEALKNFHAGPGEKTSHRLRWRAPIETLRGPCSLWKETHEVTSTQTALMATLRERRNEAPPASVDDAERPAEAPPLPKSYTAYKLVCEVDNLLDGDFQTLTHIADHHNCSFGIEAMGDKVLIQLAFVR